MSISTGLYPNPDLWNANKLHYISNLTSISYSQKAVEIKNKTGMGQSIILSTCCSYKQSAKQHENGIQSCVTASVIPSVLKELLFFEMC